MFTSRLLLVFIVLVQSSSHLHFVSSAATDGASLSSSSTSSRQSSTAGRVAAVSDDNGGGGADGDDVGDDDPADAHSNYPLRCLVRQFNFTATVTDANGKRCRGQVSTKACFGSCDSYEVGTFEFPWIVRVQPVCNYNGVVMKEVRLSDCDPGVDNGALVYRFPEASSCSCAICDPTEQACETSPRKRRSIPVITERARRRRTRTANMEADSTLWSRLRRRRSAA